MFGIGISDLESEFLIFKVWNQNFWFSKCGIGISDFESIISDMDAKCLILSFAITNVWFEIIISLLAPDFPIWNHNFRFWNNVFGLESQFLFWNQMFLMLDPWSQSFWWSNPKTKVLKQKWHKGENKTTLCFFYAPPARRDETWYHVYVSVMSGLFNRCQHVVASGISLNRNSRWKKGSQFHPVSSGLI